MLRNIDQVEGLLKTNGYSTTRLLDFIVATTVSTKTYTNNTGDKAIEILITFDKGGDCLAVEVLRAFDLRKTVHKEATLACLLTATARAPLLRPSLDPTDGEIRLRIDCPCGTRGARDGDLLKALSLLPWFADNISPHISAAMEKGSFDPNQVRRFHFPKLSTKRERTVRPTDGAATTGARPSAPAKPPGADCKARAEALAKRPGGSPGRLTTLYAFHQWLASLEQQQRKQQQEPLDKPEPPKENKENENHGHDA
jgi:hypothetical protein